MSFAFDNIVFALQRGGGISHYWYELLSRMQRDRYKIKVIEHAGAELNIFRKKLYFDPSVLINERSLPLRASQYLPYPTVGDRSLYISSYYRVPGGSGNISVVTVYDFMYERFRRGPARLVHSMQKRAAVRAASGIICISNNTKRDLLEFYPEVSEEKIRVIYLGISDSYRPLGQDCGRLLGSVLPELPYVLFVGGRHSYKNFRQAVETVAGLSDYCLISVGGGELNPNESELLRKHLPTRHVHLTVVDNERLNLLYNCAHALLYPSSYEGFGLPVLEAMAAGCPVIAVNASSIPEVCGDAGLLVDVISAEMFADKIIKLQDPEFRNEMIDKGYQQAKRFSWEKCYQETIAFYKKVMTENELPILRG